jgi:hypothetical protein
VTSHCALCRRRSRWDRLNAACWIGGYAVTNAAYTNQRPPGRILLARLYPSQSFDNGSSVLDAIESKFSRLEVGDADRAIPVSRGSCPKSARAPRKTAQAVPSRLLRGLHRRSREWRDSPRPSDHRRAFAPIFNRGSLVRLLHGPARIVAAQRGRLHRRLIQRWGLDVVRVEGRGRQIACHREQGRDLDNSVPIEAIFAGVTGPKKSG